MCVYIYICVYNIYIYIYIYIHTYIYLLMLILRYIALVRSWGACISILVILRAKLFGP